MKERIEKVKGWAHDRKSELVLIGIVGSSMTLGYVLGKAAGALTFEQVTTLMNAGVWAAYGNVKANGIEYLEKVVKKT